MQSGMSATFFRVVASVGAIALLCALTIGGARADDKTYVMKITLPTLNDAPHQLAKNFAAAVERDSGGRIKAEIYPASQLGAIPRQIEGTQFGAIQVAIEPPEFFVGVDERFEVMTAPGMIDSLEHGQRVAADPAVLKVMLALGADKGLHGAGMFIAEPDTLVTKTKIEHLSDLQGKKIRIFASDFQSAAFKKLGVTPVAMTLGDVMPALQQGAIDGAIAGLPVFAAFHYQDAAKYITETNQPSIFLVIEISKKWYESLPSDLQQIVDKDAAAESVAINPVSTDLLNKSRQSWRDGGGELNSLPPEEQALMIKTISPVAEEVSKTRPALHEAYEVIAEAAKRLRQVPGQ
jgi:TRAP-type transport system periplasmic protein